MPQNHVVNISEIPKIEATCCSRPIELQLRSQGCYTVIDSREVLVHTDIGIKLAVIMSLDVNPKRVGVPNSDVLFYFAPVFGVPSFYAIHPTVLFWRGKFWTTFTSVKPPLKEIAEAVQLKEAKFGIPSMPDSEFTNVDLVYPVQVTDIPELDWEPFNG